MEKLLENIIESNRRYTVQGELASYIPELTKANKDALGIFITTLNGEEFYAGDNEIKFTIQSISKIISLIIAIMDNGKDYVFSKVGMEPTKDSFNSIIDLELNDLNKPLNPMINAGAIATVSMIRGKDKDEVFSRILEFTKKLCGNEDLKVNESVYISEKKTGSRNRALAYFMKSTSIIEKDVEEVLDVYFKQCSIEVTSKDLSKIALVFANEGVSPWSEERIMPKEVTRIIKTIMTTCGMYDASGEFAVNIGLPSKSGVGGGILAVAPGKMGIGIVGPALDEKGNSIAGVEVLKDLSHELELSIF
ncbi:glutaminase A [Clostridium sp. MSJ-11]|uniref:Glutaminase n=1 Tax=Clostridium mobile TaxID=2841512 RepID=A0ABS6EGE4_9CLOT|nr:glutaminase A [Clostridium mobile]MBU5483832.1 glutaminase A [Clostridium mobile]